MLVLTRRLGEQIVVGDDVVVTVVAVGPGRIRLGIEAPRSTPVQRREIAGDDAPPPAQGRRPRSKRAQLAHASAD